MKNSRNEPPRFMAFPGAEEWELWKLEENLPPEKVAQAAKCSELVVNDRTIIVLPSTDWFFTTALLSNVEPSAVREMAFLQLEAAGVVSAEEEKAVWDFRSHDRREASDLVQIACLNDGKLSIDGIPGSPSTIASFEALPLQENTVTIWKELGRWNCVVTDSHGVILAQRLGAARLDSEMAGEVICLVAQLELEGLTQEASRVVILEDSSETELQTILAAEGFNPVFEKRPPLQLPSAPLALLPIEFAGVRKKNIKRGKLKRSIGFAMVAVLILLIAGVAQTAWVWYKHEKAARFVRQTTAEVAVIRSAAQRWNSMAPAIDPSQWALEAFYRCARHLPPAGVCFTLFDYKPAEILIIGEADSVPGVVEFQNSLSKDVELSEYQWKIPPPRILPNNVARFEISGRKKTYGFTENAE